MKKKILFVDDEIDVLRVSVFRLKKAGYDVVTATNGQEALDLVRQIKPDLVLLDVRLPVLAGELVCKRIKQTEDSKHIPVILFTASLKNLAAIVKETCADDFLAKPFDTEQLLEKVKKFIG